LVLENAAQTLAHDGVVVHDQDAPRWTLIDEEPGLVGRYGCDADIALGHREFLESL
jgi:hypothetical protein